MLKRRMKEKTVPHETTLLQDIGQLLLKIGIILICLVLTFLFIFGGFRNREISMKPSVRDGDFVIYYRLDKNYTASDVAVVEYNGKLLTGRVVAAEGDTVDITADGLIINGAPQQEADITAPTKRFASAVEFPVKLGAGQIFLLGDNRERATDSRIYGPIDIKDTKGKVVTVIRRRNI